MKAAEILRQLIDVVEPKSAGAPVINIGTININTEAEPAEPESDQTDTMVPPLQQKIELLKKNAGLDNVYDQQADDDEPLE